MTGLLNRRTAIIIAAACSLTLMVSCASSRRMERSSPFSDEPESSIRQTAKSGTDSSLKLTRKTDNPPELNVDQERVNFWPLVYRRPGLFTVLWPMADFDKNGMAIRPFYVRDGDEYSVMFPLAAWNPVNKDGWVLNTYWEKTFNGSFPIYHMGPKFNFAGPVWWTKESVGFPGFCFSRDSGLNYGGPFWYNSSDKSGGFFPLCCHKSAEHGWFFPLYYYDQTENNSIYLPLYGLPGHYRNNHGDKSLMVLIYCHYWTKDNETVNDMLLPLYLYRRHDNWNTFITLPFMYGADSKSDDYCVNAMGPLFYRSVEGDKSHTAAMFALGGSSSSPEKSTTWAMPFFFKEKDKTSDCMYLFPYYCENNADGTKQIRSAIPFYHQKNSPDNNSLWLFPYYQSSGKDRPSSCAVFPMFYYGGTENNLTIMPLLSNFSSKRTDILFPLIGYGYKEHSFRFWPVVSVNEDSPSLLNIDHNGFSFIGSLGFEYRNHKTEQWDKTEFTALLLLLSSYSVKEYTAFPPERLFMDSSNSPNMIEFQNDFYFLYFGKTRRNKVWNPALINQKDAAEIANSYTKYKNCDQIEQLEAMKARIKLIAAMQKYGMQSKCETEEELTQEIKKFGDKYTVIENEGKTFVLPLFFSGYKETPITAKTKSGSEKVAFKKTGYSLLLPLYYSSFEEDEFYANILFFMAESTRRPEYKSFRVLRYLYHAEEQNDKYSYDVFPFISMRGSKEFSSYSFGWHLFNVRKDKQTGKRSGHICFIPF